MRAKHFCVLTKTESRAKIWYQWVPLSPLVAWAAVRSKAVALLLLIYCLLLRPWFGGVLYLVLVLLFDDFCPSSFAIVLMGKTAGCFALTVFLMSCDSQCSVVLPRGAVD